MMIMMTMRVLGGDNKHFFGGGGAAQGDVQLVCVQLQLVEIMQ